jgi:[acyl-carrier-protein] S-malonyltransferase
VLALLFPGQGSQRVGMGRDVFEASAAARAVFAAADSALSMPLSRLCFEGPEEELVATEVQQPAILATSIALLRALEERVGPTAGSPLRAGLLAGHSLGEYTALVAASALALEDALRLVRARGAYMQEAVPAGAGAMAALLGAAPETVEASCARARDETGEVVEPANYNAPEQTVISGTQAAVRAACVLAKNAGARRAVPLPVSAPFHCALMAPAAEKLAPELARIRFADPLAPVVANATAEPNELGARVPELLRRQVTEPVRFTAMVRRMRALGVTRVLEIGPGRVLCGLVARIEPSIERRSLGGTDELDAAAAL